MALRTFAMVVGSSAVLLLLGCGASTTDGETVAADAAADVVAATDVAAGEDVAPIQDSASSGGETSVADASSAYPAGPYGTAPIAVGAVVPDIGLEGYVRFEPLTGVATEATYGPTSLAELRTRSPRKYAVIHVSGFT